MTQLTEYTELLKPDIGIYRREDTWLGKACSFCGGNVPKRYWVLDICRGKMTDVRPTETTLLLDAQVQVRQTCCADHAVKDLAVWRGQSGVRLSPPGTAWKVKCARCSVPVNRADIHYSLWAALIEDDDTDEFESHNHATLCEPCAEQVGAFTAAELDEAIEDERNSDYDEDFADSDAQAMTVPRYA